MYFFSITLFSVFQLLFHFAENLELLFSFSQTLKKKKNIV